MNSYLLSVVWQFAVFGLMVIAAVTARGHGSILYSPGSRGGGLGGNVEHLRLKHGFSERLIRPAHGQFETYDRGNFLSSRPLSWYEGNLMFKAQIPKPPAEPPPEPIPGVPPIRPPDEPPKPPAEEPPEEPPPPVHKPA